jgi:hypothetical protein
LTYTDENDQASTDLRNDVIIDGYTTTTDTL